jgi:single-strand DNA-binding protein
MEFTGRLTEDAQIKTIKNDKKVVTFSVAVNDYVKPKNGEAQNYVTYINCSYWITTALAERLQKGAIVSVYGRVYLNQYKTQDGEQHSNIACHANFIKVQSKIKKEGGQAEVPVPAGDAISDLPF